VSRVGRLASAGVVGLVLGAGLLWWFQDQVLLGLVGFAVSRRVPVGPTQSIAWDSGPDPLGRAPSARPPNIVLILADDLGWNDLTATGAGIGEGAVPTPNIDSIAQQGVSFSAG
jgi:hypothetical protein